MKHKEEKTLVMKTLEANGVEYEARFYDEEETDGQKVAILTGLDPDTVFKTLVTVGSDMNHYVFVVPVNYTLNLKKAAAFVKVKSVEMIKQKDLLPLTGYVHGGCSPLCMKKKFVTVINDTALLFEKIACSGGKRGCQIIISPQKLAYLACAEFADLI